MSSRASKNVHVKHLGTMDGREEHTFARREDCLFGRNLLSGSARLRRGAFCHCRRSAGAAARSQCTGAFLFGDKFAGTAHLGGKVPHFRKPVAHRQHCLGVVDMKLRPEREIRDGRREYVDQPPGRKA